MIRDICQLSTPCVVGHLAACLVPDPGFPVSAPAHSDDLELLFRAVTWSWRGEGSVRALGDRKPRAVVSCVRFGDWWDREVSDLMTDEGC